MAMTNTPWDIAGNRKKQRVSTGGCSNTAQVSKDTLSRELIKWSEIGSNFIKHMSLSGNRLGSMEKKIESVISLRSHVNNMGSVVRSHSDRIKLLRPGSKTSAL